MSDWIYVSHCWRHMSKVSLFSDFQSRLHKNGLFWHFRWWVTTVTVSVIRKVAKFGSFLDLKTAQWCTCLPYTTFKTRLKHCYTILRSNVEKQLFWWVKSVKPDLREWDLISNSWGFAGLLKWATAHSLTKLPVSAKNAVKSIKNKPSIVSTTCFTGGTNKQFCLSCLVSRFFHCYIWRLLKK